MEEEEEEEEEEGGGGEGEEEEEEEEEEKEEEFPVALPLLLTCANLLPSVPSPQTHTNVYV
jgi:hypothetical protein